MTNAPLTDPPPTPAARLAANLRRLADPQITGVLRCHVTRGVICNMQRVGAWPAGLRCLPNGPLTAAQQQAIREALAVATEMGEGQFEIPIRAGVPVLPLVRQELDRAPAGTYAGDRPGRAR